MDSIMSTFDGRRDPIGRISRRHRANLGKKDFEPSSLSHSGDLLGCFALRTVRLLDPISRRG